MSILFFLWEYKSHLKYFKWDENAFLNARRQASDLWAFHQLWHRAEKRCHDNQLKVLHWPGRPQKTPSTIAPTNSTLSLINCDILCSLVGSGSEIVQSFFFLHRPTCDLWRSYNGTLTWPWWRRDVHFHSSKGGYAPLWTQYVTQIEKNRTFCKCI